MLVSKRGLRDIFTTSITYVVPLFQRPYVWERDANWEPLWESIESVADAVLEKRNRHHFLGAVVLEQLETATGDMSQRQVIDGQQRLTTLQLFLAAFRSYCVDRPELADYVAELDTYTRNRGVRADRKESDRYKVWPTNSDRALFKTAMAESFSPSSSQSLMEEAREWFRGAISEWFDDCAERGIASPEAVAALFAAIDERIFLAVLDLDRDDDSLEIFETLNALGTPLLASDLIKNYSLRMAISLGLDIEMLFDTYFRPFEQEKAFWNKEVSVGRFKRKKIDVFYQYFLGLVLKDDIVHEDLFGRFREYVETMLASENESKAKGESLVRCLKDIRAYADLYFTLEHLPADQPSRKFLDLLERLETTTFMPIVLLTHHATNDATLIHAIEDSIASYLMRRMVIRETTKSYNRLVSEILGKVGYSETGLRDIPALLMAQTAASNRWPADDEVQSAFVSLPLYKVLKRSRLQILLERIDEGLNDHLAANVQIQGSLQIEHLMPQAWKDHWQLPADKEPAAAERERERIIHTIGNLTLITGPLNASISNGAWSGKRRSILAHNAINMNREFQGESYSVWDESKIEQRSMALAEVFCRQFARHG